MLCYTRMENARKLALRDKTASVEDITIMSALKLWNLIVEKYEVVTNEREYVLLILKDKMK